MNKSIVAALAIFGIVAMAGAAGACPAGNATGTGQQSVVTGPATPQTPMPGKPGG